MSKEHFAMGIRVVALVALGALSVGCAGEASGTSETEVAQGFEALSDNPCTGLCSPNSDSGWVLGAPTFSSGNIGTGAYCRYTYNTINGGNCGNMSARTLRLNGQPMTCNGGTWAAIPPSHNAGWCIQVTAGSPAWAYYTLWR